MSENGACEDAVESRNAAGERTWHLSIAYDGTDFHGWQIQPQQRTVQGELQHRLRRLFRRPELRLVGSSRTDAGVHALDQQVSFSSPSPPDLDPESLRRLLNRWLPTDIRINSVRERPRGFSARFDNCGKAYTYCIHPGEKPNPLFSRFVWHVPRPLDMGVMERVGRALAGEKDFASFAVNAKREEESTVRRVRSIALVHSGDILCISVVGESFLYKMVRSLVGYLVHIGLGKGCEHDVESVLAARNRNAAADSAPAAGLFLRRVFFTPDEMAAYRETDVPFLREY